MFVTHAIMAGSLEQDRGGLSELPPSLQNNLAEQLSKALLLCKELGLRSAYDHIETTIADKPWMAGRMAQAINEIRQRIESELKYTFFLFVPLTKLEYYDKCTSSEHVGQVGR
jgi:hypothetical protein